MSKQYSCFLSPYLLSIPLLFWKDYIVILWLQSFKSGSRELGYYDRTFQGEQHFNFFFVIERFVEMYLTGLSFRFRAKIRSSNGNCISREKQKELEVWYNRNQPSSKNHVDSQLRMHAPQLLLAYFPLCIFHTKAHNSPNSLLPPSDCGLLTS